MAERQDFTAIVADHHMGVWRYLRLLGCDDATAEDLTQEAFLALWRGPFEYRSARETGAYLRTAARHLFLNTRRRAPAIPDAGVDALASAADRVWSEYSPDSEGDDFLDALSLCMDGLTEQARKAIEMRYQRDAARKDIAAALDLSEAGARTLLQRAKAQLRECVERRLKRGK